jgi:hypothetical protein
VIAVALVHLSLGFLHDDFPTINRNKGLLGIREGDALVDSTCDSNNN